MRLPKPSGKQRLQMRPELRLRAYRQRLPMRLSAARIADSGALERARRSARRGYWIAGFGYVLAALCLLPVFLGCAQPTATAAGSIAPNHIEISPRVGTSGMPSRNQFDSIASAGYQVVINLAPPNAMGSHKDEADLVAAQGMRYYNIPVDFARPTADDYAQFVRLMHEHRDERVLVHCQVNMRASSFVFLYRVLELGEDSDRAYDAVLKIWQPAPQWRAFIKETLATRGVRAPMALDG